MMRHFEMWRFILLSLLSVTVWCQDPEVDITEPKLNNPFREVTGVKDKSLDMTCVVRNKPFDREVKWMGIKDGTPFPIDSSYNQKYVLTNPRPMSYRLQIQNLQVTDEAEYRCRVQVTLTNYKEDIRFLRIVEPPQIIDLLTSSDITIEENEAVTLSCNASGRPTPVVIWSRLGDELLPNGGLEMRGGLLPITAVRPNDRGQYICRSSNEAGMDVRKIRLKVRFSPLVSTLGSRIGQKIGYRKSIVCDIEGYPSSTEDDIAWAKDGLSLEGPNYIKKYIKGARDRVTSKLTILRIGPEDYGQYTCRATNQQGTGQDITQLYETQDMTDEGILINSATVLMSCFTNLIFMISILVFCHY